MNHITVSMLRQELQLHGATGVMVYRISTAANGSGCEWGSFQTPRGLHRIRLKIGEGCPINTVFVGRRPTGEVFSPAIPHDSKNRDWILSRILWLEGLVPKLNRGGSVDTLRRHIYIHGTADEHQLGMPVSHGCIRMANSDVIDLFDRVNTGSLVTIKKES